jgi:nucleotide-binding universal stress UspA family protein
MTTLLVPLDTSDASEAALPAAGRIARELGADVVLLAVGELPETPEQKDESRNQVDRIFARAIRRLGGLSVRQRVDLHNDPESAIFNAVDEEHADVVVMASADEAGSTTVAQRDVAEALRDAGVRVEVVEQRSET